MLDLVDISETAVFYGRGVMASGGVIIFLGPSQPTLYVFFDLYLSFIKFFRSMKKHPTKFAGYYITEDGKVFREPHKFFDGMHQKDLIDGVIEQQI
jgi:hypothetical protein